MISGLYYINVMVIFIETIGLYLHYGNIMWLIILLLALAGQAVFITVEKKKRASKNEMNKGYEVLYFISVAVVVMEIITSFVGTGDKNLMITMLLAYFAQVVFVLYGRLKQTNATETKSVIERD